MEKRIRLVVEVIFDDKVYEENEVVEDGSVLFYTGNMEGIVIRKL